MLIKTANLDLHCIEPLIYHSPQLVRWSDQSGSALWLLFIDSGLSLSYSKNITDLMNQIIF